MSRSCHSCVFSTQRRHCPAPRSRGRQPVRIDTGVALVAASPSYRAARRRRFLLLAHFSPLQVAISARFFSSGAVRTPVWKNTPLPVALNHLRPPAPRPGHAARRWRLPLPVRDARVAHQRRNFSYANCRAACPKRSRCGDSRQPNWRFQAT